MIKWKPKTAAYQACAAGLAAIALSACETSVPSSGTSKQSAQNNTGFVYYLPKHQLVVSGEVTFRKTVAPSDDLTKLITTYKRTDVAISADLELIRDPKQGRSLDVPPGVFTSNDFSIGVTEKGFLKSVNADSSGRAGEVIKNVAKFVATLVPVIAAAAGPVKRDETPPAESKPEPPFDGDAQAAFERQGKTKRYFLIKSTVGRELWLQTLKLDKRLADLQDKIEAAQTALSEATAKTRRELRRHLFTLRGLRRQLLAEKETLEKAFNAAFNAFKTNNKIGRKELKYPFQYRIDLDRLPPFEEFRGGMTGAEVNAAFESLDCNAMKCEAYSEALELWRVFNTLIAMEPHTADDIGWADAGETKKPDFHIHYRRSKPLRLAIYQAKRAPSLLDTELTLPEPEVEEPVLVLNTDSLQWVMHPQAKPIRIGFKKSAFTQRKLVLTLNEAGQLTQMQRVSGSAAEGATGAVATAAADSLATVKSSLETVRSIKNTQREIKLDQLRGEVARLQQEKAQIDAEVALQGATATQDLLLRKAEIDAQLSLRQQEIALDSLEPSQSLKQLQNQLEQLQTQQALDTFQATAAIDQTTKVLTSELTQLQTALELEKATATQDDQLLLNQMTQQTQLLTQQILLLQQQQKLVELENPPEEQ